VGAFKGRRKIQEDALAMNEVTTLKYFIALSVAANHQGPGNLNYEFNFCFNIIMALI